MGTNHFLLNYNRKSGALSIELFGEDQGAALTRLNAREAETSADEEMEIVLIGADSLETIRITHPHYFEAEDADKHLVHIEDLVRDP